MFSPVLKFTLHEKFNAKKLEVSETMEITVEELLGMQIPAHLTTHSAKN